MGSRRSFRLQTCGGSGYKGRIGVHEGIVTDTTIASLLAEGNPSEREIKIATLPQNIFDMAEDGIVKVLGGITSLEELERVVDLSER